MKPATDLLQSGKTIETTTRQRVVEVTEPADQKSPDFWEYVRKISTTEWAKHMVYLYRVEPKPSVPIQRSGNSYFTLPNNQTVPIGDQEELEFALAQHYGGGVFRLIVKKGPQWVAQERIEINAPVRAIPVPVEPGAQGSGATVTPINGDATAQIAGKAIDTIAGQEHMAVRIGIDALNSAANVVRSFGDGRPAPGAPADDITRQMMQVMINRMMQPPQDPIELLAKVLALQAQLNPQQGGGVTGKLLEAAIDKFLNPVASGPAVSAGAELVRTLPSVAGYVSESIREWRMGMEAQRDGVMAMRAPVAAGPQPTMTQSAPQVLPPRPNPTPTPPNGAAPPMTGAPSLEFIEGRIIDLLRQPMSGEEAADRALEFLYTLDGENPDPGKSLVGQLASHGETGLLQLFQVRPILKQATANMPRLIEFIRAFLKLHADDQAEEGRAANDRKPN